MSVRFSEKNNTPPSDSLPNDTFANKLKTQKVTSDISAIEKTKSLDKRIDQVTELLKQNLGQTCLLIERVTQLFSLGVFQTALDDVNKILEKEPEDVAALTMKGKILHQLREYGKAVDLFNKALEIKAKISSQERHSTKSGKMEEEILNQDNHSWNKELSDDKGILFERGVAYFYLKQYLSAFADFDFLLDQDPMHLCALSYRGAIFRVLKKYERAMGDVEKVLKNDPKNALALSIRGALLIRLKNYDKAKDDLIKAVESDSKDSFSRLMLGKVYALQGKNSQAYNQIDLSLEIDPNNPSALCILGNLFFSESNSQDNIENVLICYNRALNIDPTHLPSLCARALALTKLKRYKEAEEDLNNALQDDEMKALAQELLLNVYRLQRKERKVRKMISLIYNRRNSSRMS